MLNQANTNSQILLGAEFEHKSRLMLMFALYFIYYGISKEEFVEQHVLSWQEA